MQVFCGGLSERVTAGLILTGIMLFPVYWMVNVSFTRAQDMRKSPPSLFPFHGTVSGYVSVWHQQLPFLGTSLVTAAATVLLTLLISAPAGYSLAKLRPRGSGVLDRPGAPGVGRDRRPARRPQREARRHPVEIDCGVRHRPAWTFLLELLF